MTESDSAVARVATEGDKLEVLLAEYSALRDMQLQRDTSLNQVLVYGAISIIAIVSIMVQFPSTTVVGSLLLVLDVVLAFTTFKLVEFDVLRAAERLFELETEINLRAGERLLQWETTRGLQFQGYQRRVRYVLRGFAILLTGGLWRPPLRPWY